MDSLRPHLVVVGAGMVAARFLHELAQRAPNRFRITLIGKEDTAPYDRVQLSAVLAGTHSARALDLMGEVRDQLDLTVQLGTAVTGLDPVARRVTLACGTEIAFDLAVLATGSEAVRLPLPGGDLAGVRTFRDLADVEALSTASGRAVVIGGGLLGLEAAAGLRARGLDVALVHLMPWLMERQLDEAGGAALAAAMTRLGIELHLGAKSEAIEADATGLVLELEGGTQLPADLVVMAVGVRPHVVLARDAGLACNHGIVVDDGLKTSAESVFALGECVEHRGTCYGLVWPLYAQARVLAQRLTGESKARFEGATPFTSLKVAGVEVFSAGATGGDDELILRDPTQGIHRKLVLADGRLKGAVLVGDAAEGAWYAELIEQGVAVDAWRDRLMFGRAYVPEATADEPPLAVAAA
ncbi:MAG: FAD-dependent oxidoreductase [Pseudomonadota bacterium]